MRYALLVVALAACSPKKTENAPPSPATPTPVVHAPDPIAPLYERVLPGGDEEPPLFGPGGTIDVGERRWALDGHYLGHTSWDVRGQSRPLAIVGSADHPLLVGIGWGEAESLAEPDAENPRSWLFTAAPNEAKPIAKIPIDLDLYSDEFALSPNRTMIAVRDADDLFARNVTDFAVVGRTPIVSDEPITPCWVDDARLAWVQIDEQRSRLYTLTLATRAVTTAKLEKGGPLVCDPSGGVAAMVLSDRVVVLDLASATVLATSPIAPAADDEHVAVAVAQHGARLAIAQKRHLAIYHREGSTLTSLYSHALLANARLAFTPDGTHLAVATTGLTVFGPPAEAHAAIAPRIAFDLPATFGPRAALGPGEAREWDWAQLATPPGMTAGSSTLVDVFSRDLYADVVAIAIPRDELVGVPALDATDEQMTAFAKTAMPQLVDQWESAKVGTHRDDDFTLRVGTTKGKPWFETRELMRDGCEPYDGYTRVVVDRDAVFVVRALVPPGGDIKDWLEAFFELPFGPRLQLARRRGPESGPC